MMLMELEWGRIWYQECGNVTKIYLHGHGDYTELNVSGSLRWYFVSSGRSKLLSTVISQTRALLEIFNADQTCETLHL